VAPGYAHLQWAGATGVPAKVRFDADLGAGIAWRQYDLHTVVTPHAPDFATPTMDYRLVQTAPSLLDLVM
jgi:hypothetical protein